VAVVCPTVTTNDPHIYREQMELAASFAKRIHIDLADGVLAPNKLIDIEKVWWPDEITADIHLMFQNPDAVIEKLIALRPSLVVLHAEADGDFMNMAARLHAIGIRVGLALLPETEARLIHPVLPEVDHVLIFSGQLGHFGGRADLSLLGKAGELLALKPNLEIGWDGGISATNIRDLVEGQIDVLNTGGYIQKAEHPQQAYARLKELISEK
jgi:ribulose-phosphate 3-epimerase